MTLQSLESQLLALTSDEKLAAIHLLTHSLSDNWRGITKIPGVCGGDACVEGTRIPVWVLVSYRRLGVSERELLANYPTLFAADLANAWVYTAAHPEEIDQAILENDDESFDLEDH
jgi:uncharacterized protein (DUF433 family)